MKRTDQFGFAAVEAVLVLVIVGVLGFTGWFVWHAKQNTDTSLKNSANSQPAIAKTSTSKDTKAQSAQPGTVQTAPFSGLPSGLRSAIVANADCVNSKGQLLRVDGQVNTTDQNYVANTAAIINQCQTHALYADVSGQWKFIAVTQVGYDCSALKTYSIPVTLLKTNFPDASCLDANGNLSTYQ